MRTMLTALAALNFGRSALQQTNAVSYRAAVASWFAEHAAEVSSVLHQPGMGLSPSFVCPLRVADSNVSGALVCSVRGEHFVSRVMQVPICRHMPEPWTSCTWPCRMAVKVSVAAISTRMGADAEVALMRWLHSLVLGGVIPHALLVHWQGVVNLTTETAPPWVSRWLKRQRRKDTLPDVVAATTTVMEFCDGGTLQSFLSERRRKRNPLSVREWRTLLFQALYTLAVLDRADGFRHNDAHMGNWGVVSIRPGGDELYHFEGRTFRVPRIGVSLVVMDLDWACSRTVVNAKVEEHAPTQPTLLKPDDRPVGDAMRLLMLVLGEHDTPEEVCDFVRDAYSMVATPKALAQYGDRLANVTLIPKRGTPTFEELPCPDALLEHAFFGSLVETRPTNSLLAMRRPDWTWPPTDPAPATS